MNLDLLKTQIITTITQYGGSILLALFAFIIGRLIIGKIARLISTRMSRSHVDHDVQPFLISLITVVLNVMLLLSCAGILGIQTTSFVAVLGAAGLAIGLALQGSLANFAGGVLILIFKPFRIGDLITAQGFTGHVEAIRIFDTVLVTNDNKSITLPNGPLSTGPITNMSSKGIIRVDMVFAAGSQNGVDNIRTSLKAAIASSPHASKDHEHDTLVTKLTENAIFFDTRVWTKSETFWETYYEVHENVSRQFVKDNIEPPLPAEIQVILKK